MAKTTASAKKKPGTELTASDPHAAMHGQQRQFLAEHGLWHDEIKLWQDELKRATAQLQQVRTQLCKHQSSIAKHAAASRLYEQDLEREVKDLADYQRARGSVSAVELKSRHQAAVAGHDRQRQVHERLKRLHHTVVAHWSLLLKALAETAQ